MTRLLIRLLPGALVIAASAIQPTSAQTKDGENWEVTSQMQMAGMPAGMQMPQQPPRKVCRARNSENPPVDGGDKCTLSDVKRSGNTVTWKMACEHGSGTGEMTYIDKDNYKGTVTMSSSGHTMTVNMSGHRLPGDCDPGERRQLLLVPHCSARDCGSLASFGDHGSWSSCSPKTDVFRVGRGLPGPRAWRYRRRSERRALF